MKKDIYSNETKEETSSLLTNGQFNLCNRTTPFENLFGLGTIVSVSLCGYIHQAQNKDNFSSLPNIHVELSVA